ncbi:MAG: nucleotide exchange factor GrpE [Alphaproteobacteria bacterium]|nr:nucleotide exchange factor GrpE [Alphaproteobacteria bacterium]
MSESPVQPNPAAAPATQPAEEPPKPANDAGDARIAELEAKLAETKDGAMRALAEADNIRKRAQREIEDSRKYALSSFAKELLGALDNLDRALASVPEAERGQGAVKTLTEGVALTARELLAVLARQGVQPVDPLGQKFDANLHQAMFEVEHPTAEPGSVVQVMAKGYVMHGRLLRPALVGVAKRPPPAAGADLKA